jgi:ABC-type sugar transport system ATPase subunit
MTNSPTLVLEGVSKSFGSVNALEHVDFKAYPGEIHAIVGDNGAGKSTLVKIVSGIHSRDSGEVYVNGDPLDVHLSTALCAEHGIAVVYQDLALVECLDISTNMALGGLPTRFGFLLDRRRMDSEASTVLSDLAVRVGDVKTSVGLLSGGQRQIVAIARAVRLNKPIVLLDEPTAALGVRETAQVSEIMLRLKAAGKVVVLVSHDLELVFRLADRVTVLRLGNSVATRAVESVTKDELVALITGLSGGDASKGLEK